MNDDSLKQDKKVYIAPTLEVYGSIATLTCSTKPVGMGDGAMSGTAKT